MWRWTTMPLHFQWASTLQGHVDFYPVSISSETGLALGKTVYVGYGITTEDGSYDDFNGLNVEGPSL